MSNKRNLAATYVIMMHAVQYGKKMTQEQFLSRGIQEHITVVSNRHNQTELYNMVVLLRRDHFSTLKNLQLA